MTQAAITKICGSATRISVVLIDKQEHQIEHAKNRLDQFIKLELKELEKAEGEEASDQEGKEKKKRKRVQTKAEEEKVAESDKDAAEPNQPTAAMSEDSFEQHDW